MRAALAAALAPALVSPAQAMETRPVVIELFTSQGCSSCPPADALLTELAQGKDVLALAFHVDYWNRLGWTDPYSSAAFTARQRLYGTQLGEETIYTPELVIDGARAVVGSDRAAVADGIASARRGAAMAAAVEVHRVGGEAAITVGAGPGGAVVLLVGFDRSHLTPVGRGENSGRMLQETNIVRSLSVVGPWSGVKLGLRVAWPAGEAAAVLLQAADGRIVGAAVGR